MDQLEDGERVRVRIRRVEREREGDRGDADADERGECPQDEHTLGRGRPRRERLCGPIDRGHRELPVEASVTGRAVEASDSEIIEVRLQEIDNEERVVLVDRVA